MRSGPWLRALWAAAACATWLVGAGAGARGEPPRVVASIQPLHSLVAAVMGEAGEPILLVRGANSPHDYSLTPADARALSRADLVVWAGQALELVLAKPIAALADEAVVLEAIEAPGVEVLARRAGGAWQAHEGEVHGHDARSGERAGGARDGHIWLDPRNAIAIAAAAAEALSGLDPANAQLYGANATALGARLRDLEADLAATLAPVRAAPYVVFHDAYQYFERRFGMNAVGAITIGPERAPGAKRIVEIRARLRETGALCVFAEPQFEPALARTVVEGTKAKIATLDPLGAGLTPGPTAYPELLRRMARSLRDCLIAAS